MNATAYAMRTPWEPSEALQGRGAVETRYQSTLWGEDIVHTFGKPEDYVKSAGHVPTQVRILSCPPE